MSAMMGFKGSDPQAAEDWWRRDWFCAGPSAALAEDGAHVTVDLPFLSITVQNFAGVLAGFLNVCSHRATKMRCAGRGRGVLRCPYHGWTYNRAGVPVGIPDNEQLFQFKAAERQALALMPVAVARRGALLFLRVAAEGPDLGPLPDHAGRDGWQLVEQHDSEIAQPWATVLQGWAEESQTTMVAPNLVVADARDWLLLRHILPSAPERCRIAGAVLRTEAGAATPLPSAFQDSLDRLRLGAVGP
jgi:nitrite reductase/ring-hydroxylating ferredoxin subunit